MPSEPLQMRPFGRAARGGGYVKSIERGKVGLGTLTQSNVGLVADLAARRQLPSIYFSREFVDAGGFMAYGVSYPDLYRRAAKYVDKIFRGAKPADLPIEQPTKFELAINMKAAKTLGLTIPPSLLLRADQIVE